MRLLTLLLFSVATPSAASNFQDQQNSAPESNSDVPVSDNIPITVSSAGVVYSGNVPSLRANEKGFEIWVIADHSSDKSVVYRESRQLWKFDCLNRQAALSSWVQYSSSGKILSRGNIEASLLTYEPVVPDTVSDGLMKFSCKFGPRKAER